MKEAASPQSSKRMTDAEALLMYDHIPISEIPMGV